MGMHNKKIFITTIACMFLLISSLSVIAPTPIENWHDTVEDWEVQFCHYYGGKQEPDYTITGGSIYMSTLSLTLQAQKGDVLPDGTQLYEIGYYVQPIKGKVLFRIDLSGKDGESMNYKNKTSVGSGGIAGYESFYRNITQGEFDKATMHITGVNNVPGLEQGPVNFEVPVVYIGQNPQNGTQNE